MMSEAVREMAVANILEYVAGLERAGYGHTAGDPRALLGR
jgi:hypothetical protein